MSVPGLTQTSPEDPVMLILPSAGDPLCSVSVGACLCHLGLLSCGLKSWGI